MEIVPVIFFLVQNSSRFSIDKHYLQVFFATKISQSPHSRAFLNRGGGGGWGSPPIKSTFFQPAAVGKVFGVFLFWTKSDGTRWTFFQHLSPRTPPPRLKKALVTPPPPLLFEVRAIQKNKHYFLDKNHELKKTFFCWKHFFCLPYLSTQSPPPEKKVDLPVRKIFLTPLWKDALRIIFLCHFH